jgi:hypothetical protein
MKAKLVGALLALGWPAQAATHLVDISDMAGFTRNGVAGVAGNGIVWLSPKYYFGSGDTVDFGTATVIGDYPDGRSGCGGPIPPSYCTENGPAAFKPFFLVNGAGGFSTAPFDLSLYSPMFARSPGTFALLFTLGSEVNGIQLAFQGTSLSITPPLVTPIPGALPLFVSVLGLAGWLGWRRKAGGSATDLGLSPA